MKVRILWLFFVAIALSACVSNRQALLTLESLKEVTAAREKALIEQTEVLAKAAIGLADEQSEGLIDRSEAVLIMEVLQRISAKERMLVGKATSDTKDAFNDEVTRLEDELLAAQRAAAETNNQTAVVGSALKLSAGLTAHARETLQLTLSTQDKISELRAKSVGAVTDGFTALRNDPALQFDADAISVEIASALADGSEKYQNAVKLGFDSIERYIDERDKQFEFFAKGLVGEDLGAKITAVLKGKIEEQLSTVKSKIASKVADINAEVNNKIQTTSL